MRLRKIWNRHWNPSEILTVVLLVILALGLLVRLCMPPSQQALVAVVTIHGEKKLEIPLSSVEAPEIISLLEEYGVPVHLEVDTGKIRFVDVTCPDHLCEKSGWLVDRYQSAVCMPNRTVVSVYEASDIGDGVRKTADLQVSAAG